MELGEQIIEIIRDHKLVSECIGFDGEGRPITTLKSDVKLTVEEVKLDAPQVEEKTEEAVAEETKVEDAPQVEEKKPVVKKPTAKKKPTSKKKK